MLKCSPTGSLRAGKASHGCVARTALAPSRTPSASPLACNALQRDNDAPASWTQPVLKTVAAAVMAVSVCMSSPAAMASDLKAPENLPETVYFGNGCFWGRQFDFVNTEKKLGRQTEEISALVGYAGGTATGPDGKVCYYQLLDSPSVYEKLGHAEVVQVALNPGQSEQEFRNFAKTYFKEFRRTETGKMQRLDPQDAGPGYRNVIGLPGGVDSPLFKVLQEENINNMELRAGSGNQYVVDGRFKKPTEDDLINVVWIVDSQKLPFYPAEKYHQFHNGIGKLFPLDYTFGLKNAKSLPNTGCPELPF